MELFHIIDEGQAILVSRGVYRQAKVYRRGADVYAGHGAGFIKLCAFKGTSAPRVGWLAIEADGVQLDRAGKPTFPAALRAVA